MAIQYKNVVALPPYVAPEHQPLIDNAESMLKEYSDHLEQKIKARLFGKGSIEPTLRQVSEAEQEFLNDPTRRLFINNLMHLKRLYEMPRVLVQQ